MIDVRLTPARILILGAALAAGLSAADWQPAKTLLMTPWGEQVTPANAWQEYPRPALAREHK